MLTLAPQPEEVEKIDKRAQWSEESDAWRLRPAAASRVGAAYVVPRPGSTHGGPRPVSQFARLASLSSLSENPRFKPTNILQMELDLPERTTQDAMVAHADEYA